MNAEPGAAALAAGRLPALRRFSNLLYLRPRLLLLVLLWRRLYRSDSDGHAHFGLLGAGVAMLFFARLEALTALGAIAITERQRLRERPSLLLSLCR